MENRRTYTMDPAIVKFDEKIVKFNPPKPKEEMESLLSQIENSGQLDPILMRNGLCGDGYHRCKICKELGIYVKCIDVDNNISDADFIVMCNKNTFGARNDSPGQKAIKAFRLTRQYSEDFSDAKAAKIVGVKDTKTIGYVRYISDTKYEKDKKVLDAILAGDRALMPDDTRTSSVETAKRKIRAHEELELKKKSEEKIHKKDIDYSKLCETGLAEEEFWRYEKRLSDYDTKIRFIELLNVLYDTSK